VKPCACVAAIALWIACTVDRKTDQLQCTTGSDCDMGRICNMGYCTTDCPADCTDGCDGSTNPPTCNVNTNNNAPITCPTGFQCNLSCNHPNSCSTVDCSTSAGCTITCNSTSSCANVTCGTGPCNITCNGGNSCGDIQCSDSCACDVTCNDGQCNQHCPSRGGHSCTQDGTPASDCSSSDQSGCNTCP